MLSAAELPTLDLDGEQLVRPDFAGRGLANVASTVLRLLAPSAALELPPLDSSVLPESLTVGVKNVVVLLADGLGYLQLQREMAAGNAPNLAELVARSAAGSEPVSYAPITSVFPTTTVAALGSVNSGVAPSGHGLLGYTLYLPEFDTVADMIRWGPTNRRGTFGDAEFGSSPESFFWAETLYARLQAARVTRTFAINPAGFVGTALTRMLHQYATFAGYIATSSIQPMVTRLLADADERTYVYAYWPTVDSVTHIAGPMADEHGAEVSGLDHQIGRLLRSLPRRDDTLLIITADHGHIDTDPDESIAFAEHPELLRMLRAVPAGERRAVYLYPKAGATTEVAGYTRERLRDVAATMLRDDAVEQGLFGPGQLSERAASRIGEVLLFPRGTLQLVTPSEVADGMPLPKVFRGLHGGLTPDEALVPLVAVRT
jgi:hypothetical protein